MPKLEINIPKPCTENWNQMSPEQKGRFCGSCQKTVYDFTRLSDRAILEKIQSESSLCGRFSDAQLNRELNIPKNKSAIWTAAITGILSFLSAANDKIQAQTKLEITQSKSENLPGKIVKAPERDLTISGIVSGDGLPLPGAFIKIEGTEISAKTDFDGKFIILARENDTLICSFLGYEDYKTIVYQEEPVKIVMKDDIAILDDVVFTGKIHVKRNFFGRLFHSLGKIFE